MILGGARALHATPVVPFDIQKCFFFMSLEAPPYPLPYGTICIGIGGPVCRH